MEASKSLSELGQAALAYAARGWFVFPIVPRRKKPPLIKDYYTLSSRDPVQIAAWWTQTPEANIGLDCGKSGLVAVDADSEAGHGKDHSGVGAPLAGLMLLTGGKNAWSTLVSETPTGGEHYIFTALSEEAGRIQTDSNNFGVGGIDVRAKGGYIVLPPSKIESDGSTRSYRFKNDVQPLPLPRKLLSPPGNDRRGEDGLTALEEKLAGGELVTRGSRDNFLHGIAGKLSGQGFNYEEILAAITASYETRCIKEPPFDESDFQRIAKSALKYHTDVDVPAQVHDAVAEEPGGSWNASDETVAIPASEFLATTTKETEYVVAELFQAHSLNMFMGPPKAGKSTLLRHLAVCCAYGIPFLGRWTTKRTPVLYYSLQENKPHLRKWLLSALCGAGLAKLGEIPPGVPIDFVFRIGHRGQRAIKGTLERIIDKQYGLVIIDMWGRYAGVESFDDYAENEAVTDALNAVAQKTGACIIWSHHERKSGGGGLDGFAGAIGSQSIRGSVYTTLRNWKDHGRYYISTEQRDGDDLPATAISLDPQTQAMRTVGSSLGLALTDEVLREKKVREFLLHDPNLSPKAMADQVGGRPKDVEIIMDRIKREFIEEKLREAQS